MSADPNDDNVKRLFEQMAVVVAGEPTIDALCAAQDMYAAMLCIVADSKAHALESARMMYGDLYGTIDKNFDWYRDSAISHPSGRG